MAAPATMAAINWTSRQLEGLQAHCRPEAKGKQEKYMTQKTEFEIEVSETVAYSSRSDRFDCYCTACKCMTEMATVQIAVVLIQKTEREIYRMVEDDAVHFVETDRAVLVCLNSLPGYQRTAIPQEEQL